MRTFAKIVLPRVAIAFVLAALIAATLGPRSEPATPRRVTTTTVKHHRHRREPHEYTCKASPGHKLRTGASEAKIIGHCRRDR